VLNLFKLHFRLRSTSSFTASVLYNFIDGAYLTNGMRSPLLIWNRRKTVHLQAQCRPLSSSVGSTSESVRYQGQGETPSDDAVETEDAGSSISTPENRVHQTFYIRKGGNKALPLSSFLDPARLAQRHRHKLPKPSPPKYDDLTEFRRRMADNPYG
jgi:hypothetical protein